jgi:co-chaperonin GroES (HSP10)
MRQIAFLFVALVVVSAQGQTVKSFVGTVLALKAETAEIEIKPDNAAPVSLKIGSGTIAQRIAPGEKDLKTAEAIQVAEVAVGDRVLVTPEPGTTDLRRIIVMAAADIAKRNEADRMDWTRRGVSGVVAAKNASEITLRMRTMTGEKQAVVTVGEQTAFKRYAPDSVKFADAKGSKLAEVNVGDQLRARGRKTEDGLKVTADDVVFGTFLTKAGSVTAVNLETREVTVKDLTGNQPMVVRFTADSQLKKMPDGMMRPGGGGMDIAQMLERMPAGKLEDLKPGDTIVVSSTKGAKAGEITAIMFLSNAGMLIQMASMPQGGGRSGGAAMGGMGGGSMDLGSMGLGGIIP